MAETRRGFTTVRAFSGTAQSLKVAAAAAGVSMTQLLDEIIEPELSRLEREHFGRHRASEATSTAKRGDRN